MKEVAPRVMLSQASSYQELEETRKDPPSQILLCSWQ